MSFSFNIIVTHDMFAAVLIGPGHLLAGLCDGVRANIPCDPYAVALRLRRRQLRC